MAIRFEDLVGTSGIKSAEKEDCAHDEDENGDIEAIRAKKMFSKPRD